MACARSRHVACRRGGAPVKAREAMHNAAAIRRCIAGCVRAKDGRGRFQNQLALRERLALVTTPTIAAMTAQAARRVGEAIANHMHKGTK